MDHFDLAKVSAFSAAFPLVVLLLSARAAFKENIVNAIILLTLISASADLVSYFQNLNRTATALVFNVQDMLQFFLIAFIYYQMYLKEYKTPFYLSLSGYVVFEVLNSIFFQPVTAFQNFSWTLTGLIFILFSIGWKLNALMTTPVLKMSRYSYFWINTAILCYFAVNLFLFILTNYVFTNMTESVGRIFWSFHNFNNIVKNVLFAVGIYYFSPKFMVSNRFDPNPA